MDSVENGQMKCREIWIILAGGEADVLYEAIPVWERAYAVSETKRCVEGAAGTRGADKDIAEALFVYYRIACTTRGRNKSTE